MAKEYPYDQCPLSPDGDHCNCYWDGFGPCCYCGLDEPEPEQNPEDSLRPLS